MGEPKVVVRAVRDGNTSRVYPYQPTDTCYDFKKGEIGILNWEYFDQIATDDHKVDAEHFIPRVIWDNDREQKPRRTSYNAVEIFGIEQNGIRFYVGYR